MMTLGATVGQEKKKMSTCPNCLCQASSPFCPTCGQEQSEGIPTVSDWLHEVMDELFFVEGKLPKSIVLLLTRPGALTLEWVAGRRAQYVSPFRLYLLSAVVFFLVARTLAYLHHEVFLLGGENPTIVADVLAFYLLVFAVPLFALCARLFFGAGTSGSFMPFIVFSLHAHAACLLFLALALFPLKIMERISPGVSAWAVGLALAVPLGTYVIMATRRYRTVTLISASAVGVCTLVTYGLFLGVLFGVAVFLYAVLPFR